LRKALLPLLILLMTVTFEWDYSDDAKIVGFRLYQSQVSGQYIFGDGNEVKTIPAFTHRTTLTVEDGFYYWVLTAFGSASKESKPSNEVTNRLSKPTGIQLK
jgi:hypothetical protein